MKQYLCIEDGEQFLVDAKNEEDARAAAELWNAQVISEYKPRKQRNSKKTKTQRRKAK